MTSTILSSSSLHPFRSLYRWALRQHMGLSVLYMILLFLAMPGTILIHLIQGRDYSNYINGAEDIFSMLCIPLTMLFTLLFSALHFSYLHKKRAIDLFYSLPAKRNTLLSARLCAAATHVLAPLLINYLLMQLLLFARRETLGWVRKPWMVTNAGSAICFLCLAVLASLVFSALIYVCSGTGVDAIVSIFVINGIYPALVMLLMLVSENLLTGVMVSYSVSPIVYTLASPYLSMLSFYGVSYDGYSNETNLYAIWWVLFTVALLALTLALNRKRKSESAETGWAFAVPNVVIRIAASATAGLGLGTIMAQAMSGLLIQFILGMVIGAFAMHMILEAVYSRGLRRWLKSLPYYGSTVAVLLCFLLAMSYGMNGIVNRIPAVENIEQVSCSIQGLNGLWDQHVGYYRDGIFQAPVLTEEENIQLVTQIQQEAIRDSRTHTFSTSYLGVVELDYTLKDGTHLKRSYQITNAGFPKEQAQELLDELIDSREFIEKANSVFQISPEQTGHFQLEEMDTYETADLLVNAEKKEELLNALKQDILEDSSQKREEWIDNGSRQIVLSFQINSGRRQETWQPIIDTDQYMIPDYYTRTRAVLDTLETDASYE